MSYDDDKFAPLFPTRFGGAIGTGNERKMLDNIGGGESFRTKVRLNPDGSTTTLRTRDGMPRFTTVKKEGKPTVPLTGLCFLGVPRDDANTEGYSPLSDGRITSICKAVGKAAFDNPAEYSTGAKTEFAPHTAQLIGALTWYSRDIKTADQQPIVVSWAGCNGARIVQLPDVREPRPDSVWPVPAWPHEKRKIQPSLWVNGSLVDLSGYLPTGWGVLSAALAKDAVEGWLLRVVAMHDTNNVTPKIYTFNVTRPFDGQKAFRPISISNLHAEVELTGMANVIPAAPPFFNKSASKFAWVVNTDVATSGGNLKLGEVDAVTGVFAAVPVVVDVPASATVYLKILLAVDYVDDEMVHLAFITHNLATSAVGSQAEGPSVIHSRSQSGYDNLPACDANLTFTWTAPSSSSSYSQVESVEQAARFALSTGEDLFQVMLGQQVVEAGSYSISSSLSASTTTLSKYESGGSCVFDFSVPSITATIGWSAEYNQVSSVRTNMSPPTVLACDLRARLLVLFTKYQETEGTNSISESAASAPVTTVFSGGYPPVDIMPPLPAPQSANYMTTTRVDAVERIVAVAGGEVVFDESVAVTNYPGGGLNSSGTIANWVYVPGGTTNYTTSTGAQVPTTISPLACYNGAPAFGISMPTVCAASADGEHAFVQVLWPAKNMANMQFVRLNKQTGLFESQSVVPFRYSPGANSTISGPLFLPLWGVFP